MSAAARSLPPLCAVTPGCTGTGNHVCTVLRRTPTASSPDEQRIYRELVRESLRARFKVSI